MKLLWTVGYFGTLMKEGGYIELDSQTFMSQKIYGMYNTLLEYLEELRNYDIFAINYPNSAIISG